MVEKQDVVSLDQPPVVPVLPITTVSTVTNANQLDKQETLPMDEISLKVRKMNLTPDVIYGMAMMFYEGQHHPKDHVKASGLFYEAAQRGHAKSQAMLAMMLFLGDGIPKNLIQASMWEIIAKSKNVSSSISLRDCLDNAMLPDDIAKAQEMANNWKPKR